MSEEFLAVVKLVSGEEIVAKVTELEDDQIVIECPAMMNSSSSRRMNVNIVKIEPWIKSGRETTYIVGMDKVLTISEIFDEDIAHTYTRFAMAYYYNIKIPKPNKITKEMGYVSSVKDARASLEKLFNES